MSTKLILIRHAESEANFAAVYTGQSNFKLTEKGFLQAKHDAEYLKHEKIDAFYASDLIRALDTARTVAAPHGAEVIPEKGLREIFAGAWEGQRFTDLIEKYPEEYATWRFDLGNARPTGGESVAEMQTRVRGTIEKIVTSHPGETVCVVTHATPIRVMRCFWEGKPLAELKNIPWTPNAGITTILYEKDLSFHDLTNDIAGQLAGVFTELPKNV